MVKKIIEYMMHRNNNNNEIIPYFVEDGGYFVLDTPYKSLIGVSCDTDEIFLPDGINALTNQELIDRVVSMDLKDEEGNPLTDEEKTVIAETWLSSKGFEE